MTAKDFFSAFVGVATACVFLAGMTLVSNGCTLGDWNIVYHCKPDAGDECAPDAGVEGGSLSPESLMCEDHGGACVEIGASDFEHDAVLLWLGGDEMDAPKCPERAALNYFTGYNDLVVDVQCDECKCSAPTCVLPHAIGTDTLPACGSGVSDNYAAPNGWDGSCFSPAQLPAGSFASFALPAATVTECKPSTSPPIQAPGAMAPRSNVIFGGIGWRTVAKACAGEAFGKCSDSKKTCVPNALPPPPEFRYCVKYQSTNVDEADLPQCPNEFPERHVFYKKWEGTRECSPCACGEPKDGQCIAAFSAYQDPACGDMPAPFFKDIAGEGCVFAMPWTLGAISAKWVINAPGKCEPSGGEPVGEVKPTDPRVFCCQPLPETSMKE